MTEWPSDRVTKWPSGLVSSSKSEAKTSKEERRQAETSKEKQRRKAQTYENNSIQIKQLLQPQAFQAGLLLSWLRQVKHQDIPRPASVSCIIGIHYWDQVPDAGSTSGQCGNCHVQSEAEHSLGWSRRRSRGGSFLLVHKWQEAKIDNSDSILRNIDIYVWMGFLYWV